MDLLGPARRTADARQALQLPMNAQLERIDRYLAPVQDGLGQTLLLVEHGQEQMFGIDLLVTQPASQLLRPGQRLLSLFREAVEIHGASPRAMLPEQCESISDEVIWAGSVAPLLSPLKQFLCLS